MTKKTFDNAKVRSTIMQQDVVLNDKFDKADAILLKAPEIRPSTSHIVKRTVIRDTFSMPEDDYARIGELRLIAAKQGRISTSKSEVVRAGLQALSALNAKELAAALNRLEKLLPGRKK